MLLRSRSAARRVLALLALLAGVGAQRAALRCPMDLEMGGAAAAVASDAAPAGHAHHASAAAEPAHHGAASDAHAPRSTSSESGDAPRSHGGPSCLSMVTCGAPGWVAPAAADVAIAASKVASPPFRAERRPLFTLAVETPPPRLPV